MERVCVSEDQRNGNSDEKGNKHEMEFYGDEIAAFSLPRDGKERVGSVGIDFTLYRKHEGGYVLIVESWSRRKGGRNSRIFETFASLEEMEEKVIYEDFYTVEIPRKLIERARRKMLTQEVKFYAPLITAGGGEMKKFQPACRTAYKNTVGFTAE